MKSKAVRHHFQDAQNSAVHLFPDFSAIRPDCSDMPAIILVLASEAFCTILPGQALAVLISLFAILVLRFCPVRHSDSAVLISLFAIPSSGGSLLLPLRVIIQSCGGRRPFSTVSSKSPGNGQTDIFLCCIAKLFRGCPLIPCSSPFPLIQLRVMSAIFSLIYFSILNLFKWVYNNDRYGFHHVINQFRMMRELQSAAPTHDFYYNGIPEKEKIYFTWIRCHPLPIPQKRICSPIFDS